ncbi:MAG: hypothetical protein WDO70_05195 [Alphaproteobacteria bacterium]
MNIRRGFFRIWIVASIVWAIGVGCESYEEIAREFEKPPITLTKKAIKAINRDSKSDEDEFEKILMGIPSSQKDEKISDQEFNKFMMSDKPENGATLDGESGKEARTIFVIARKAVLALSFPTITICIWFLGAWIIKGFSTKSST